LFENDSDFFFLEKPPVNLEDAPPHVEPLESSNTDVKVRISGRHIHTVPVII